MIDAHGSNVCDANDVIFAAENRLTAITNTSMDGMHGQRWHQRRSRQLALWSKTGKRRKWFLSLETRPEYFRERIIILKEREVSDHSEDEMIIARTKRNARLKLKIIKLKTKEQTITEMYVGLRKWLRYRRNQLQRLSI